MGDNPFGSCPTNPPLHHHTYSLRLPPRMHRLRLRPDQGTDIVGTQFLSLNRFQRSKRSTNIVEEDNFCALRLRLRATWWASEQEWIDVQLWVRDGTELEKRVLVFGWPSDGVGIWMLRVASGREVPSDCGRLGMTISMDERIEVMKKYGALFY